MPTTAKTSSYRSAKSTAARLVAAVMPIVSTASTPACRDRESTSSRSTSKACSSRCAWVSISMSIAPRKRRRGSGERGSVGGAAAAIRQPAGETAVSCCQHSSRHGISPLLLEGLEFVQMPPLADDHVLQQRMGLLVLGGGPGHRFAFGQDRALVRRQIAQQKPDRHVV